MTEEKKEYIPHFQKVEEIKNEAQKSFHEKHKLGRKINLSPQQMKLAEVFSRLLAGTALAQDFADYLAYETNLQTDCIMKGFTRKSAIVDQQGNLVSFTKSYGEDMSYNEGNQHGLFAFKGHREDALKQWLELQKQKQETKNENEKNK